MTEDRKHLDLVDDLFREAQRVYGPEGTFQEIANAMNALSTMIDDKPDLTLSKGHVYNWFRKYGGACKKRVSKPVLTEGSEADVQWWITLGLTIINAIELLFILLAFYAIIAVAPAALVSLEDANQGFEFMSPDL